jgi:hypothetical protein
MAKLRPHTPEWFGRLAAENPHRAASAAQIVQLAGTLACCTLCGDATCADYQRADAPDATAKLCVECRLTRQKLFGEDWVPFTNP